ncbi:uncharacterized protein F4822DRAFT_441815 [Hypoxylon trugodes]|uniref:uncharacterized protein n=1 Tax=Hypoxylon trugodes TaxID=326681 RepID=UPI00219B8D96|nr:uncharacterized protein F4822DRAFT_441815 [Hypoxylon trugodes]KAI1382538.1 hypothetical protein F4822DRAFT_441815 [Hypoxylon trugodes]
MALLYKTVPAFEDTWIECLGDLGRYREVSDKAPTTGRLYHHLAILARPNPLQQLYYCAKSLCVPIPFSSAREYYIAIADYCGLLSYGQDDNVILKATRPQYSDDTVESSSDTADKARLEYKPNRIEEGAFHFFGGIYSVVLRRLGDLNIPSFLHVVMKLISLQLDSMLLSYREYHRIHDENFPRQDKEFAPRPLPEDFAMKGLVWIDKYFPVDWFSNDKIDDNEKYFEVSSMTDDRKERILWLGHRIAKLRKCVVPAYEKDIDNVAKDVEMATISETVDPASPSSTFGSTTIGNTPSEDGEDMVDIE